MKLSELTIPRRLSAGDTVAFLSISGGRAGDPDMLPRYRLARKRFEESYGVKVVETPNALRGSAWIYAHPQARAEDLEWALKTPAVKGIVCCMGGDDSYRVLPYIHPEVIREHPKVFMGYSDIATWMAVFLRAGVRAYYGPCVLTPIGAPVAFDAYSRRAIQKTLFEADVIGEVKPCDAFTPIEWNDGIKPEDVKWTPNSGYSVVQGAGRVRGRLLPLCGGPLQQIMGTPYFPDREAFEGAILAIEHGAPYGSPLAGLHSLRAFAAAGAFDRAAAVITGRMDDQPRRLLRRVINEEACREDMAILENVDFVHHTPMTVLPTGAFCEIDCDQARLTILEPGVL